VLAKVKTILYGLKLIRK